MTKLDFSLHDEKHFFRVIALAIQNILGIELHGLEDRQEFPEKIRVLVGQEAELVDYLTVALHHDLGSDI